MPRVPQTDNVVPMQPQAELPSPTLLAMAAVMMHQEGHLVIPNETPKFPIRSGPKDEDVVNFERSDVIDGRSENQRRLMSKDRSPDLKAPELTPSEAETVPGRRIL